jgi:hypothetical protein
MICGNKTDKQLAMLSDRGFDLSDKELQFLL